LRSQETLVFCIAFPPALATTLPLACVQLGLHIGLIGVITYGNWLACRIGDSFRRTLKQAQGTNQTYQKRNIIALPK
jgi:hypothetical protein